ncbi:MAG: hypothetical protein WBM77_12655, partial [Maribacter sp.]
PRKIRRAKRGMILVNMEYVFFDFLALIRKDTRQISFTMKSFQRNSTMSYNIAVRNLFYCC